MNMTTYLTHETRVGGRLVVTQHIKTIICYAATVWNKSTADKIRHIIFVEIKLTNKLRFAPYQPVKIYFVSCQIHPLTCLKNSSSREVVHLWWRSQLLAGWLMSAVCSSRERALGLSMLQNRAERSSKNLCQKRLVGLFGHVHSSVATALNHCSAVNFFLK